MRGRILSVIMILLGVMNIYAHDNNRHIVVDKQNLKLYVVENSDTIFRSDISAGIYLGNKQRKGDHKTPEGTFSISMIQNSSSWKHDFHDGNGAVKGAYGPWFFRLKMPKWTSIGIHGTCFPESIGKRASDGCIRLNNDDLEELRPLVKVGMKVIILRDK